MTIVWHNYHDQNIKLRPLVHIHVEGGKATSRDIFYDFSEASAEIINTYVLKQQIKNEDHVKIEFDVHTLLSDLEI